MESQKSFFLAPGPVVCDTLSGLQTQIGAVPRLEQTVASWRGGLGTMADDKVVAEVVSSIEMIEQLIGQPASPDAIMIVDSMLTECSANLAGSSAAATSPHGSAFALCLFLASFQDWNSESI